MGNYALYALPPDDMEDMKAKIEPLLGIEFEAIASESWGDYFTTPGSQDVVSIYSNWNESDEAWREEEHTEFPLLLSIVDSPHQAQFGSLLTGKDGVGAVLIKRRKE